MRRFPEKSLPSVLLFVSALRNADVGLRSDLAFLKGVHASSIAPLSLFFSHNLALSIAAGFARPALQCPRMARSPDSGRLDLAEVFYSVQEEMLAQLAVGGFFEHPSAAGAATEQHWLDLFNRYLPQRYRATPAFVIDSEGRRSRQIDIAIFDNLYSPPLFPHKSGLHIPAESVYAVFEVKPTFSRQWIRDAGEKAASVRALRRTSVRVMSGNLLRAPIRLKPILAGLLATTSVWTPQTFSKNLKAALLATPNRLDLGCSLEHGSFEQAKNITISTQEESLIFFILRLLERLRAQGTAPAADLMKYGRHLESFK
jgi:hypothetical protein